MLKTAAKKGRDGGARPPAPAIDVVTSTESVDARAFARQVVAVALDVEGDTVSPPLSLPEAS